MNPHNRLKHHVTGAIQRGEKSAIVEQPATNERAEIIAALYRWIAQRPGLDPRNYISHGRDDAGRAAYHSEVRSITKDMHQARALLRYVELHQSITGDMLKAAFPRAFSGRLSWELLGKNTTPHMGLSYCTGQYWPTEYRRAVCAVLASAIWEFWRDHCLPKGELMHNSETGETGETGETLTRYKGLRAGDYLRRMARNEFGRGIASRWFN